MQNQAASGATTGQSIPLNSLGQFVSQSLPVAAVAHSYHVEALTDPTLRADERFQQFSLIELNELHHQVAALGNLLRLSQGDQTALTGLGINLAGFLQNRMLALQMARGLSPAAMRHPAVQRVMALTEMSNQQLTQYLPAIQQTLTATRTGTPGVLVVGDTP